MHQASFCILLACLKHTTPHTILNRNESKKIVIYPYSLKHCHIILMICSLRSSIMHSCGDKKMWLLKFSSVFNVYAWKLNPVEQFSLLTKLMWDRKDSVEERAKSALLYTASSHGLSSVWVISRSPSQLWVMQNDRSTFLHMAIMAWLYTLSLIRSLITQAYAYLEWISQSNARVIVHPKIKKFYLHVINWHFHDN